LAGAQANAQAPGGPAPGGWAIVNADGTLGANSNVASVDHVNTGIYRVNFTQSVSRCAANATLAARNGKTAVPGYVVIGHTRNAPAQVRVFTYLTTTLVPADFKFNLLMSCG
jgi:hypothetical protein